MHRLFPPTWITADLPSNVRARNHVWGIYIRPGIDNASATYAHECFEWSIRAMTFLAGLALGILPGALGFAPLWSMLMAPIAGSLALLILNIPAIALWLEIGGHAVETAVAVKHGADEESYLLKEAMSLRGSAYRFQHHSVDDLMLGLRKRLSAARKWAASWPWRDIIANTKLTQEV